MTTSSVFLIRTPLRSGILLPRAVAASSGDGRVGAGALPAEGQEGFLNLSPRRVRPAARSATHPARAPACSAGSAGLDAGLPDAPPLVAVAAAAPPRAPR